MRETELAMKLRFGEILRADYKPGLHFKAPFYHEVRKFERRITTRNYPSEQFLTSEGKILRIDFYIKWRISDISKYYIGTGGSEDTAAVRLGSIVKDGIKGVIARRTIQQVVAAERTEFTGEILKAAESNVAELGLLLVDVRVKKIDLPEEVSESVFLRMRQDFDRQAKQLRAEGDENAEKLRAEADRERTEILAKGFYRERRCPRRGRRALGRDYARAYTATRSSILIPQLQARQIDRYDNDCLRDRPRQRLFKYLKRPDAAERTRREVVDLLAAFALSWCWKAFDVSQSQAMKRLLTTLKTPLTGSSVGGLASHAPVCCCCICPAGNPFMRVGRDRNVVVTARSGRRRQRKDRRPLLTDPSPGWCDLQVAKRRIRSYHGKKTSASDPLRHLTNVNCSRNGVVLSPKNCSRRCASLTRRRRSDAACASGGRAR